MERVAASGFSDVDQSANPSFFVQYLNTASTLESVKEYKRATYTQVGANPGRRILDVGCGIGDDVRAIAQLVGHTGWVVGVDSSQSMIAEAEKRTEGLNLPVEFRVGDAQRLDFDDKVFDGSRADRVLQHVEDPRKTLSEMIRVTRLGGRVAVLEPDWETLVVDHPNRPLTRTIANAYCDEVTNGWIGRRLPGLFVGLGLKDVDVITRTLTVSDYTVALQFITIEKTIERLRQRGMISGDEGANWLADLERQNREGTYFGALTLFGVAGTASA